MYVLRLHRELYIQFFFFILPRAGSGETGTRQMLSDSTRGSRGWFFGVCAVKYALPLHREQGDKWSPSAFCSCHPGANGFLLLCQNSCIYIYTYTAHHPVYVCVCVQRTLLFPAGKTRGGQHAINRGPRGKLK